MLFMRLYHLFVFLLPLMISRNSVAPSQRLWKRQTSDLCPNSKWKEFQGACFLEIDIPTSHSVGHNLCRNKFPRSQMAKIRSMDDLNFIRSTFKFKNNYWIGLNRRRGDSWLNEPSWQDGSNATFLNFLEGQPTNSRNADCISIRSDLGFYDTVCNQRYWSICSISASEDLCKTKNVSCHDNARCYNTFLSSICVCNDGYTGDGISNCTTSDGCPNAKWKEHKGLCYRENVDKETFEDARYSCRRKFTGSSLAKIRYEGDRNFLASSFNFSGNRWLGIKRTSNTWRDQLRWLDQSIVTYKVYQTGQPNNDRNREFCMVTNREGDWNDLRCTSVQGSFCSIKAMESSVEGIRVIIVVVVLNLLAITAYIGYKKITVQRRNAESDSLTPNDGSSRI